VSLLLGLRDAGKALPSRTVGVRLGILFADTVSTTFAIARMLDGLAVGVLRIGLCEHVAGRYETAA